MAVGTEVARHPFQEGYESLPGPNIEDDWTLRAACLSLANAVTVFMPGHGVTRRDDVPVCDGCPVRESCLMDSFARGNHLDQGRRGRLTPTDRERIDKDIRWIVNGGRLVKGPARYGPDRDDRNTFYSSKPLARSLIVASALWTQEALAYNSAKVKPEHRPHPWPTPEVVELVAQANQ